MKVVTWNNLESDVTIADKDLAQAYGISLKGASDFIKNLIKNYQWYRIKSADFHFIPKTNAIGSGGIVQFPNATAKSMYEPAEVPPVGTLWKEIKYGKATVGDVRKDPSTWWHPPWREFRTYRRLKNNASMTVVKDTGTEVDAFLMPGRTNWMTTDNLDRNWGYLYTCFGTIGDQDVMVQLGYSVKVTLYVECKEMQPFRGTAKE